MPIPNPNQAAYDTYNRCYNNKTYLAIKREALKYSVLDFRTDSEDIAAHIGNMVTDAALYRCGVADFEGESGLASLSAPRLFKMLSHAWDTPLRLAIEVHLSNFPLRGAK